MDGLASSIKPTINGGITYWPISPETVSGLQGNAIKRMKMMGRTVRTYRDGVRIEEGRWKDFRRTLRPSQRERFDRIFDYARGFADAGTMMVTPRIIEVILLSAILEMLGEIDEIKGRVQVLEEKIEENTP